MNKRTYGWTSVNTIHNLARIYNDHRKPFWQSWRFATGHLVTIALTNQTRSCLSHVQANCTEIGPLALLLKIRLQWKQGLVSRFLIFGLWKGLLHRISLKCTKFWGLVSHLHASCSVRPSDAFWRTLSLRGSSPPKLCLDQGGVTEMERTRFSVGCQTYKVWSSKVPSCGHVTSRKWLWSCPQPIVSKTSGPGALAGEIPACAKAAMKTPDSTVDIQGDTFAIRLVYSCLFYSVDFRCIFLDLPISRRHQAWLSSIDSRAEF